MSSPRQLLPDSTYLISRRCAQRRFCFVPALVVNMIIGYCIAEAAALFNIGVHGVVVMTNHIHLVVTDPDQWLPKFMARVHRQIALCMKAEFGWTENFWSTDKASVVRLEDAPAVLRKIVYAQVNPVRAGLVKTAADWPGFHTANLGFGESRVFQRPRGYFREDGPLPDTATLVLTKPPAFDDMTDAECTLLVKRAVGEAEAEIRAAMRAEGRKFLGAQKCRQLSRSYCPSPDDSTPKLSPTFATQDRETYLAALARRQAFLAEYRAAYERWKAGDHDVEFPPGTYWLRVHAGVRCRAPT